MVDIKCPFCNKQLQPTLRQYDEYWCENHGCPGTNIEWVGSQKLWQELIRTRKALDIAVDALKLFCGEDVSYYSQSKIDARYARTALEQITVLEQKG